MNHRPIQMVDLSKQYLRYKQEIDVAMQAVIDSASFINGAAVREFSSSLASYLDAGRVIPCANGTDALQITLMGLGLEPGNEVIVPAFTYVAAAEAVAMLGLSPVLIDVDRDTFNLDVTELEQAITRNTKAIVAVHLFGLPCPMEPIMKLAKKYNLQVIEDNAQALGADCIFSDGTSKKAGTVGDIGTTSFFPSKPLACYGDGGAMICSDASLGEKLWKIANHGQEMKYRHEIIGCNSRLDTIQAAVLNVKLKYIEEFTAARRNVAARYDEGLKGLSELTLPIVPSYASHVYHQYTVRVGDGRRDSLKDYLKQHNIPSMVYYPYPLHVQEAYKWVARTSSDLQVSTQLCQEVLSLPIHTEMDADTQTYIIETIHEFYK